MRPQVHKYYSISSQDVRECVDSLVIIIIIILFFQITGSFQRALSFSDHRALYDTNGLWL